MIPYAAGDRGNFGVRPTWQWALILLGLIILGTMLAGLTGWINAAVSGRGDMVAAAAFFLFALVGLSSLGIFGFIFILFISVFIEGRHYTKYEYRRKFTDERFGEDDE